MPFTRNVSPAPRKNRNVCLKGCEKRKGKRHGKGEWKATFQYINKETDGGREILTKISNCTSQIV